MSKSNSGCGGCTVIFLLLIVSVALNAVLLTGCTWNGKCLVCGHEAAQVNKGKEPNRPSVYDASNDLREIANKLGVDEDGNDAAAIADAIKTKIYVDKSAKGFPRDILTDVQLKELVEVVPEEKGEVIKSYHKFIKAFEGKRFLVVP